jgi:diguanylate cyclase (GGDEF)-like protein
VAFAGAAGAALAQRAIVAEQQARTTEQAGLARAATALNATLDLRAVLQAICDEARAILGGDTGVAFTGSREDGLLIEAGCGLPPDAVGRRVAPGEGLSGRVLLADRALLTNDYQRIAAPRPGSPFHAVRSGVSVPLHWDGRLRGVLAVGFTRPRFVGARDLALLQALGEIASAACRNASDAERLSLAARTDGLTGALNHAALQETLAHELERSEARSSPLALVLLDLDGFKQVNDREGHLGGDELLRDVAEALRASFRPSDVVARYGGDEFAVVVPDTDEQVAAGLARDAVARIGMILRRRGHAAATGATAGVARHRPGTSATQLLAAADEALLHGKQELGRGTVVRAADVARPAALPALLPRRTPSVLAPGTSERRRLHKRTRQLVLANALGSRLAAMTDAAAFRTRWSTSCTAPSASSWSPPCRPRATGSRPWRSGARRSSAWASSSGASPRTRGSSAGCCARATWRSWTTCSRTRTTRARRRPTRSGRR